MTVLGRSRVLDSPRPLILQHYLRYDNGPARFRILTRADQRGRRCCHADQTSDYAVPYIVSGLAALLLLTEVLNHGVSRRAPGGEGIYNSGLRQQRLDQHIHCM